jgi:hypothetical protein
MSVVADLRDDLSLINRSVQVQGKQIISDNGTGAAQLCPLPRHALECAHLFFLPKKKQEEIVHTYRLHQKRKNTLFS